jgi:ABC-2 type transport system permease protein
MTPTRTIRLIALRELRERALKRGFLVGTAITVVLVVASVALPALFGGDGERDLRVGVVGEAPELLEREDGAIALGVTTVTVEQLPDREAAEAAVTDGDVEVALVDGTEVLSDGPPPSALVPTLEAERAAETTSERLRDAGLDDDEVAAALVPPGPLTLTDLSGLQEDGSDFLIAVALTLLLLVGVQLAGASLLSGALEEKSSRVVEVLVSAARPWQLLTAKVTATSLLTLAQLSLIVGAGLVTNAVVGAFDLPPATGRTLAITLAFLVAGFLFYASLFTVAGTLASSLEDAQSTATPLYLLMYGAYGAVFAAVLPNPDGLVGRVLTFVPATAPFVAPPRAAVGALPTWELAVSLLVTFVGAYVALRVAGRTYASSLLAGGKLTWRDAWRAEPVR